MGGNVGFAQAKKNRADEFYTQLPDIEAEMRHYRPHFAGRAVLCNCDDPFESNFFKYFALNFNRLGLKKLIATCYAGSPVAGEQLPLFDIQGLGLGPAPPPRSGPAHKIEITEVGDENADGAFDLADVAHLIKNGKNALTLLEGDGDFRSSECVGMLKEADVVVTNPPFSLFREYLAQLVGHEKKFLIIGSKNAITYKDVFQLIKENRLWMGNGFPGGNAYFRIPMEFSRDWANGVFNEETGLVKFRNVGWFTNLDIPQRHRELTLYQSYDLEKYPKYANYDAIEVPKVAEIPKDYDGLMGVPITFLDKYNPDQFEIVGIDRYIEGNKTPNKRFVIDGKEIYARIVIIRKGGIA